MHIGMPGPSTAFHGTYVITHYTVDIAWFVGPLDQIAFSFQLNRFKVHFQSSRDHPVQAISD